jgi:hypothetical protein
MMILEEVVEKLCCFAVGDGGIVVWRIDGHALRASCCVAVEAAVKKKKEMHSVDDSIIVRSITRREAHKLATTPHRPTMFH